MHMKMHYAISKTIYTIYQICIFSINYNYTHVIQSGSNITQISSLGLINKHEQFNLNYSSKHNFSRKYFMNTIHGTIHVSLFTCHYSHKPGTVFNSPKNRTVGCSWAAHSPNVGSSWWNRIPYPFPVSYSPKHNLFHKI